jgi:hypothetical protein
MAWLLIGTGLLLAFLYFGRRFVNAEPRQLVRYVRMSGAVLAVVAGVALTLRGGAIIGGPLALLGLAALFPGFNFGGRRGPSAGGASQIETDWVRMRLDRGSGAIDGEVKRGAFAGRTLAELDEAQLRALLAEASADRDAVALINAYVSRRFSAGGGRTSAPPPQGAMSEDEALAILGLQRGATADEIRAAHKRLMVKLHPDQGGSSWLAAKLNAARERLIGKR